MNSILKTVILVLIGLFLIKISIADQMRSSKSHAPLNMNQTNVILPRVSAVQ